MEIHVPFEAARMLHLQLKPFGQTPRVMAETPGDLNIFQKRLHFDTEL